MTFNGVIAVILHYCTKSGSFGANYIKVVKDQILQTMLSRLSHLT